MEVARLALEYLQLFVSWPVVFFVLVLYFLKRHNNAVALVLQRFTALSLPGGIKIEAEYLSEPATPPALPPPKSESTLESLERDFSTFLWQGIAINRLKIGREIDKLWTRLMRGAFALTPDASKAKTQFEKLTAMKDIYKLEEKAVADFGFLEGLTKDKSRKELIDGYRKSSVLQGYLSSISSWIST